MIHAYTSNCIQECIHLGRLLNSRLVMTHTPLCILYACGASVRVETRKVIFTECVNVRIQYRCTCWTRYSPERPADPWHIRLSSENTSKVTSVSHNPRETQLSRRKTRRTISRPGIFLMRCLTSINVAVIVQLLWTLVVPPCTYPLLC